MACVVLRGGVCGGLPALPFEAIRDACLESPATSRVGILGYGGSAVALGLIPTDLPGGALVGASLGLLIVAYLTTAIGFKSETDLVPIMPRTLPDVPTGVSESG